MKNLIIYTMNLITGRPWLFLSAVFVLICSCTTPSAVEKDSFSFREFNKRELIPLPDARYLESHDGTMLAYYVFKAGEQSSGTLIFIHGGGAWSGAGYQNLASDLSTKYNIDVYLMDIRGHGQSGGARGIASTPEQVWRDLSVFITFIKNEIGDTPLFLGGHSSGGGLVLNYLSWPLKELVDGYLFIAPHFGYKSNTERRHLEHPFAKIKADVFMEYFFSKGTRAGETPAVFLNYSKEILEIEPLLITSLSCAMSMSETPSSPKQQFARIDAPFIIIVGEQDELFYPEKICRFSRLAEDSLQSSSLFVILPEQNHLSVLNSSSDIIGEQLHRWLALLR